MNRRGFLKSMLAAGVAPYVVTTAGVLMPVKAIVLPRTRADYERMWSDIADEYVRAMCDLATFGTAAMRVEASPDGFTWRRVDPALIIAPGGGIRKPEGTKHLQIDTIGMDVNGWHSGAGARVVHSGPDPLIIRSPGVIEFPGRK